METGVRYRKETPDNGDSVDEDVDTETVEMVAIMAESDKTDLISPQSNEDKESTQHVCIVRTVQGMYISICSANSLLSLVTLSPTCCQQVYFKDRNSVHRNLEKNFISKWLFY